MAARDAYCLTAAPIARGSRCLHGLGSMLETVNQATDFRHGLILSRVNVLLCVCRPLLLTDNLESLCGSTRPLVLEFFKFLLHLKSHLSDRAHILGIVNLEPNILFPWLEVLRRAHATCHL